MNFMLLSITIFIVGSYAAVVPSITPCLWSDSACILNSAKKAVPIFVDGNKELGIPSVEPIYIKTAVSDNGELKFKIDDLTVAGLSKAELKEIKRHDPDSTLSIELETPIKATGTYTASGKISFVAIEGNGGILVQTDKIKLRVDAKLKKFEKDGKTYYQIDSYDFKYDVIAKLKIELDNLFNGDEKKAAPVMTIINENSNQMLETLGKPFITQLVDIVVKRIEKFITTVPVNELELHA